MKKAKNLLKIGAIYLGTVLGAGFASGQELVLFFVRFSRRGLLGCLIAGLLFCLLGSLVLSKAHGLAEKTYRNYLETVFGKRTAGFLAFVTEVFLCAGFCIMLSGSGAFFKERLSLSPAIGILVTDAICLAVFLGNLKGLSLVNLILAPIMIFGTLYVSLYTILTDCQPAWLPQVSSHGRFLPYAFFYVGYNMLTAAAVLVPASAIAENAKTAARGGVLGGAVLTLMAVLCSVALFLTEEVWSGALPMLLLAEHAGSFAYILYSMVLYMAMLTTAVSTGFSVVERMHQAGAGRIYAAFSVCFLAIPLSFVEFSVLVGHCYVFFGVLGILLVGGILWDWYKRL
ncbi:MAG: hypothetical protein E7400_02055 [Ruminococcaceae bacterium]|nr:hypothetical protein [Oscillospiraceae bacterium]